MTEEPSAAASEAGPLGSGRFGAAGASSAAWLPGGVRASGCCALSGGGCAAFPRLARSAPPNDRDDGRAAHGHARRTARRRGAPPLVRGAPEGRAGVDASTRCRGVGVRGVTRSANSQRLQPRRSCTRRGAAPRPSAAPRASTREAADVARARSTTGVLPGAEQQHLRRRHAAQVRPAARACRRRRSARTGAAGSARRAPPRAPACSSRSPGPRREARAQGGRRGRTSSAADRHRPLAAAIILPRPAGARSGFADPVTAAHAGSGWLSADFSAGPGNGCRRSKRGPVAARCAKPTLARML